MKGWLATLLVVMLCSTMLSGCNDAKNRNDGNEQTVSPATTHLTDTQATATTTLASTSTTLAPTSTTLVSTSTTSVATEPNPTVTITIDEPPRHESYRFDSYAELVQALTVPGSEDYVYLHRAMSVYTETAPFGKVYSNMLTLLENGKAEVLVPQRNGETIPLFENQTDITVFSAELYNLPWMWYHCNVDDQLVHVKYTYVSAIDYSELEQVTTIRQFLSLIAPSAPSPTNYKSYRRIYEQELVLADGSRVLAWIYEPTDSSLVWVQYYKDGVVVLVRAEERLIAEGLLSSFDLVPYSETIG